MKRVYTKNREKINNRLTETIETFSPAAREYEDVYALPLISKKEENLVLGGLCDADFNRSTISQQDIFYCKNGYRVNEADLTVCEEPVVFGGYCFGQFGLTLLFSMSRLWWSIENPDDLRKIVFLYLKGDETGKRYCRNMLELLGIDESRYEIIEKPTIFKKMLVPDETWRSRSKFSEKMFLPHKRIAEKLLKKYPEETPKKIYFSRAKFKKPNGESDGINEEYYEDFYARRGFEIIYPEQLPLDRQIRLIAGADVFASTFGSLSNFGTLFLKDGAKQVMLQRAEKLFNWFYIELFLVKFRRLDWYLVEATKNPYPTHHDGGVFFYCPTDEFKEYLDDKEIPYRADELKYEATDAEIKEYMRRWVKIYSNPRIFKYLDQPELFPILQALCFQYTEKMLDPKKFLE